MNTKKQLIICLFFFLIGYIYAQEKNIGITTGFVIEHLFNNSSYETFTEKAFLIGLQAEYSPNNAMFTITTGIQYFSMNKSIMIPVNLNLLFGRKLKFKVNGGLIPFFRLKPEAPNKTLGFGEQVGVGIEYKINKKYTLFSDIGVYFIPESKYHYSHFGDTYTDRHTSNYQYLNIGLKYLIQMKG